MFGWSLSVYLDLELMEIESRLGDYSELVWGYDHRNESRIAAKRLPK